MGGKCDNSRETKPVVLVRIGALLISAPTRVKFKEVWVRFYQREREVWLLLCGVWMDAEIE